ncbi:MAG: hypothetical protein HY791_00130 [Deltaproteobacteria bacterium]|nr:hypothetical protein [Deltaproteobacteria bacterium]
MFFLELSLTGVKGFPAKTRLSFKAGINFAKMPDATARRALVDVLYHTMYPDSSRSSATSHLADPAAEKSRAVLVFHGRDKSTYRLVRDLKSGTTRLEKFEAAEKRYVRLTETANEAAQYTRVQLRIPDEVAYDRLFILCPESQASRAEQRWRSTGEEGSSGGFAPSAPGMGGGPPGMFALGGPPGGMFEQPAELGGMTGVFPRPPWLFNEQPSGLFNPTNALVVAEAEAVERSRSKLEDPADADAANERPTDAPPPLAKAAKNEPPIEPQYIEARKRLENANRVQRAEAELERLKVRMKELEKKGDELRGLGTQRVKLSEELAQDPILRDMPAGMADRLRAYEKGLEKRNAEQLKAKEELSGIEDALIRAPVLPLEKDPYFAGGVAGAVLSLALAYTLREPWVVGLNPIAGIGAVGAALRWVNDLEARARIEYRKNAITERINRLEKTFDAETAVARKFIAEKEIEGGAQGLLELVQETEAKRKRLDEIADRIEAARKDPEAQAAAAELPRVEERIRLLEEIVAGGQQEHDSIDKLEERVRALGARLKAKGLSPDQVYSKSSGSEAEEEEEQPRAKPSSSKKSTRQASSYDDDDDEVGYGSGYDLGYRSPRSGSNEPEPWLAASGAGWGGGLPSGVQRTGMFMRPDLSRDLVQSGVDALLIPLDAVIEKVEKRLAQYVSAFTRKKFTAVSFGARGEISVSAEGGDPVAFTALEPRDMDYVDAAIRLTLAEAAIPKARAPILIDDPFTAMDPKRRKTFMQMLSYFAAVTQVIALSPLADFEGHELDFGE